MALMAPLLWSLSNILDKLAVIHHANHWTTFIFLLSIGNLLYSALIFFSLHHLTLTQPQRF
ncbi:hypothetical protein CSC27_2323 [Pseudomonas aeruginosa]|nr:hypothetical protein CSC27_2323 [Pseudomonas aeruginosa]